MLQVVYGRQPNQKAYGVLEHKKNWLEHLEMAKGRFIESCKTLASSYASSDTRVC